MTQAFPRIRRQRCLVHASRNVIGKCRMRHKGAVAKGLNAIWEAKNRQAAVRVTNDSNHPVSEDAI